MAEPTQVGKVLAQLASKWGLEGTVSSSRIVNEWAALIGEDLAARCRPAAFNDGVLEVRTDSPAWASQLKYLAPSIAAAVNKGLGRALVTSVTVSLEKPEPPERHSRPAPAPRRPRSTPKRGRKSGI